MMKGNEASRKDGQMKENYENCELPIYEKCHANENSVGQDPHEG